MAGDAVSDWERVRAAELIAALSLATDVAMCVPFEYGLQSTLVAMRLCDRLDVDRDTATQTYFLCLLFYVGCTAPADIGPEIFGSDDSFATHAILARFGSRTEMAIGMVRAVALRVARGPSGRGRWHVVCRDWRWVCPASSPPPARWRGC
jgi:hypothetical protein